MHRRAGFTLLELCLAVAIGLMLLLIAVPSVRGVLQQRRLRAGLDAFDAFVTKAQVRAVNERRTMALVWQADEIALVPMDKIGDEPDQAPEIFPISKDEEWIVERPAAMGDKPPPVWTFWRSGACEPVIITYKGPVGSWKMQFDALTCHRTVLEEDLQ
jgi:prepilin-type N-terminal cleavage/methylation domain-containing protein